MRHFRQIIRTGTLAAMLCAALTTGAHGVIPGSGPGSYGSDARGFLYLRGVVVCAACDIDTVGQTQSGSAHLFQLSHHRGQVVMEIRQVRNGPRWHNRFGPHEIAVRAADSVFAQLMAEENLHREVEISGRFAGPRTLDVFHLAILG